MICKRCNSELPEDSKFCIKCGENLESSENKPHNKLTVDYKDIIIGLLALCLVLIIGILLGKSTGAKDAQIEESTKAQNISTPIDNSINEEINSEKVVKKELEEEKLKINEDDEIFEGLVDSNSSDEETIDGVCFPSMRPELVNGSVLTDLSIQICDIKVDWGMDFVDFENEVKNSKMNFVMYNDIDIYEHPSGEIVDSSSIWVQEYNINDLEDIHLFVDGVYIAGIQLKPYSDAPDIKKFSDAYVNRVFLPSERINNNSLYGLYGLPGNISAKTCSNWTVNDATEYLKNISPLRINNGATVKANINKNGNIELATPDEGSYADPLSYHTSSTLLSLNGELLPVDLIIIPVFSPDEELIGFDYSYSIKYTSNENEKNLTIEQAKDNLALAGYSLDDIYKIENPRIQYQTY